MVILSILIVSLMAALQPIHMNAFDQFMADYLASKYLTLKSAPFHQEWVKAFCDDSEQYLVIETTRGGGKTTWGAKAFGLFTVCTGSDPEMQIISRAGGSTGTAQKIMQAIIRELEENKPLIYHYGIQQGKAWGKEHIQVCRADGHTVDLYCVGKHSSIRGARGTTWIDDPQNAADCRSETVLQADEEWFFTDVLPVVLKDQRLIFIGTPIHPLSLLSKVKELSGFKVLSFPIEDPPYSGKSAWPEQYPDEKLRFLKETMGLDRYAGEFLCDPKVSGNPLFRSEWFPEYDPESEAFQKIKRNGLFVVTGVDYAESRSTQADYSALVTLGATPGTDPDIYVLDVRRYRWTVREGAEQVFLVHREFRQNATEVESRVKDEYGGDAMIQEIRKLEKMYSEFVNLHPFKPHSDKVIRATQVQPTCQRKKVHVNRHDPNQQGLLSELTMFTGSQNFHDDMVDAFGSALVRIQEAAGNVVVSTKPEIVLPPGHRSPVTGRV